MQQLEFVSGFSELKDMLIRTYKLDRSRNLIKLYFSEKENSLFVHDYDDHKKAIKICNNIESKELAKDLPPKALLLVIESLMHDSPTEFLIKEFQLNGFFSR